MVKKMGEKNGDLHGRMGVELYINHIGVSTQELHRVHTIHLLKELDALI